MITLLEVRTGQSLRDLYVFVYAAASQDNSGANMLHVSIYNVAVSLFLK